MWGFNMSSRQLCSAQTSFFSRPLLSHVCQPWTRSNRGLASFWSVVHHRECCCGSGARPSPRSHLCAWIGFRSLAAAVRSALCVVCIIPMHNPSSAWITPASCLLLRQHETAAYYKQCFVILAPIHSIHSLMNEYNNKTMFILLFLRPSNIWTLAWGKYSTTADIGSGLMTPMGEVAVRLSGFGGCSMRVLLLEYA